MRVSGGKSNSRNEECCEDFQEGAVSVALWKWWLIGKGGKSNQVKTLLQFGFSRSELVYLPVEKKKL